MAKYKAPPKAKTWRDYARDRRYTLYPLGGVLLVALAAGLIYINLQAGMTADPRLTAQQVAGYLRALDHFRQEQGRFPSGTEGLAALLRPGHDGTPYLRALFTLPDGGTYAYTTTDSAAYLAFTLSGTAYGLGSDSGARSEADIYALLRAQQAR